MIGFPLSHSQISRAQSADNKLGTSVAWALAAHADNKSGKCYPTERTIARKAGCGLHSARRALKRFIEHGVIERKRRTLRERMEHGGGKFVYTILPDDGPRGHVRISHAFIDKFADIRPAERMVYAHLRRLANGRWYFSAALDRIRRMLPCPRSTFYRHLATLHNHGFINYFRHGRETRFELVEVKPRDAQPIVRALCAPPYVPKMTSRPPASYVPWLTHELHNCKSSRVLGLDVDSLNYTNSTHDVKHDSSLRDAREAATAEDRPPIEDQSQNLAVPAVVAQELDDAKNIAEMWRRFRGITGQPYSSREDLEQQQWSMEENCNGHRQVQGRNPDGVFGLASCPGCFACEEKLREYHTPYLRSREARNYLYAMTFRAGGCGGKKCHPGGIHCGGCDDCWSGPEPSFNMFAELVPHLAQLPRARELSLFRAPWETQAQAEESYKRDVEGATRRGYCSSRRDLPQRTVPMRHISPALFADLWCRIATESLHSDWCERTKKRVNGMLRQLPPGVNGDDFHRAMRDVIYEKWELKHGDCHDRLGYDIYDECDGSCDGSCGHGDTMAERDECDGCLDISDDKKLLDVVGQAVGRLADERDRDTRCGVCPDNGCARAVYEEKPW
jgi:hypothetical protein